jgi:hypothetical protein
VTTPRGRSAGTANAASSKPSARAGRTTSGPSAVSPTVVTAPLTRAGTEPSLRPSIERSGRTVLRSVFFRASAFAARERSRARCAAAARARRASARRAAAARSRASVASFVAAPGRRGGEPRPAGAIDADVVVAGVVARGRVRTVRRGAVVAGRVVGAGRVVAAGGSAAVELGVDVDGVVVTGGRGSVVGVVDVGTTVVVGRTVVGGRIVDVGGIVVAVIVVGVVVGRRMVIAVDVIGVEIVIEIALAEPRAGGTSWAARNPPTASAARGMTYRRLIPITRALYRPNANARRGLCKRAVKRLRSCNPDRSLSRLVVEHASPGGGGMTEVVAELEGPVRAEPLPARRGNAAMHVLLAGIVVAQLAWLAALVLVLVALIG